MICRAIRGLRQYGSLREPERRAYDRARQVVGFARERDVPIREALAALRGKGVASSRRSVAKYFPDALRKDARGRLVVRPADRNLRIMRALTTEGVRELVVAGSRKASILAQHENALRAYRSTGDDARLRAWSDKHGDVLFRDADGNRFALETDTDAIDERERRGEISYEDIYPEIT